MNQELLFESRYIRYSISSSIVTKLNKAPNTSNLSKVEDSCLRNPRQALGYLQSLIESKQLKLALAKSEDAIRLWPHDVDLLVFGARFARQIGRGQSAINLYTRAESFGSVIAEIERRELIDELAPYWHFRMMNDETRNSAFDESLREFVSSDSLVLDIGCGAGLLSMMAVRAGAKKVYACEVSELMYSAAQKVFEKNGHQNQITCINKVSTDLVVGKDLPRKVDIVVAEIFDTGLLGENALHSFAHARRYLLKPGGKILPSHATVSAVLINCCSLWKEVKVDKCCGFEVSSLNSLSPSYFQARIDNYSHQKLSQIKEAATFDFLREDRINSSKVLEFQIEHSGECHGICFWFKLNFGRGIELTTSPENKDTCWKQAISVFEKPVIVKKGDLLPVLMRQTSSRIYFELP